MPDQLGLFSVTVDHKQSALDCLQRFDLPQAKTELETASEIDFYLADVQTLLQCTNFLIDLGLSPHSKAASLAKAWLELQKESANLNAAARSFLETLICERIVQIVPNDFAGFTDADETLHVGYCFLVLNQPEQAYRKLLDFLTSRPSDESYPQLWGYFGDACYRLNHREECNSGYLCALFMQPQAVDLAQLAHPDLKRILEELCVQHDEETARALWPIHAFLENVLHISKGNIWLAQLIREQRFDHNSELFLYPAQRIYQFALCLYIDQSGLHGEIDFNARVEMQRLDAALFGRYLEWVG